MMKAIEGRECREYVNIVNTVNIVKAVTVVTVGKTATGDEYRGIRSEHEFGLLGTTA